MQSLKPATKEQQKLLEICNNIRKSFFLSERPGLYPGKPCSVYIDFICNTIGLRNLYCDGDHFILIDKTSAEMMADTLKKEVLYEKELDWYKIELPTAIKSSLKKFDNQIRSYEYLNLFR